MEQVSATLESEHSNHILHKFSTVTFKFQVQHTKKGNNKVQITEICYVKLNECIYCHMGTIYTTNDCVQKLKQVNDFQILTKSVEHFTEYME
jgi:biotin synthase-like enzyme